MRLQPVIVVPTGLIGAAISLYLLYLLVESEVGNRLQYQSWVPWFIGVVLALTVGWRPMTRSPSLPAKLIVRSLVFTLLLAPIPYGPEGTLLPAFMAMLFPPLVMLFAEPVGPLLTFLAVLGITASWESLASTKLRSAEPAAPPMGGRAPSPASSGVTEGRVPSVDVRKVRIPGNSANSAGRAALPEEGQAGGGFEDQPVSAGAGASV